MIQGTHLSHFQFVVLHFNPAEICSMNLTQSCLYFWKLMSLRDMTGFIIDLKITRGSIKTDWSWWPSYEKVLWNFFMLSKGSVTHSGEIRSLLALPLRQWWALRVCVYISSGNCSDCVFSAHSWVCAPLLIHHTCWCQHLHVCLPDGDKRSFINFVYHSLNSPSAGIWLIASGNLGMPVFLVRVFKDTLQKKNNQCREKHF